MLDFKKYKKLSVHNGIFTLDDVLSVAFIKNLNPNIEVIREDFSEINKNKDTFYLDDSTISLKHHFSKDRTGKINSTFGNLWNLFAEEFLTNNDFYYLDEAEESFFFKYVRKVNLITNYKGEGLDRFKDAQYITNFNLMYNEDNNTTHDKQFFKAVDFTQLIMKNWVRRLFEEIELKDYEDEIWENAKDNSKDGIYVLEENIPWKKRINNKDENQAKVIISKSKRGGYSVTPSDNTKIDQKESKYLRFLHASGFMGVADTLANALIVAHNIVLGFAN